MEDDQLKQLVAKVAKEELREDENNRRQSLEQFRDWCLKNPDIKNCRTDDGFLLGILRTKKFNVPMAEQLLINFLRFRQRFKDIMFDLDIKRPYVSDVISSGYNFVSPIRDDQGRQVIFFCTRNFDSDKHDWKVMAKVFNMNLHCLMEDEVNQVVGLVYVIDMADISKVYNLFLLKDLYEMVIMSEKSLPLRHKEIYCINCPSGAIWIFNILKSLMTEKLQRRYKLLSSLEELHQMVDKKVLPKELGGSIPVSDMVDQWKKVLLSRREATMSLNSMELVGESAQVNQPGGDLQGSFKTLNID